MLTLLPLLRVAGSVSDSIKYESYWTRTHKTGKLDLTLNDSTTTGSARTETKRAGLTTAHATWHRDSWLQVAIFRGAYFHLVFMPFSRFLNGKLKCNRR